MKCLAVKISICEEQARNEMGDVEVKFDQVFVRKTLMTYQGPM